MLGDLAAFASYVLERIASGENTPFARRCCLKREPTVS